MDKKVIVAMIVGAVAGAILSAESEATRNLIKKTKKLIKRKIDDMG